MTERKTVFVWCHEDTIQIDPSSGKGTCLVIPNKKEVVWEWIKVLMEAVEAGECDADLPGYFAAIAEREE